MKLNDLSREDREIIAREMRNSDSWYALKSILEEDIFALTSSLMIASNMLDVRSLQAQISTKRQLLQMIEQ